MALSRLERDARRIIDRLTADGVRHALVGGLAVSARTEPRFTRDVDLAVAVESDRDAEQLVRRLGPHGYTPTALIEQEATGRIATVRLTQPPDGAHGVVDLLFASSGIEAEIVEAADHIELFPGFSVRIATTPALIALKVLARDDLRRPQDIVDLRALLRLASGQDLTEADRLCALIEARGFQRGRSLRADLVALRADQP